jgi:hypothetical protein
MTDLNKPPIWYSVFQGKPRTFSGLEGQLLDVLILTPVQARLAMYFGEDLTDSSALLQEGVRKLVQGEPIICSCCDRNVWTEKHSASCELARQAQEVLASYKPFDPGSIERARLEAKQRREQKGG